MDIPSMYEYDVYLRLTDTLQTPRVHGDGAFQTPKLQKGLILTSCRPLVSLCLESLHHPVKIQTSLPRGYELTKRLVVAYSSRVETDTSPSS